MTISPESIIGRPAKTDGHVDRLMTLLGDMKAEPLWHGRLINTFAMLEYVGTRKILKSQRAESFTLELLEHVGEEARHAYLLKRLALSLAGEEAVATFAPETLVAGAAARAYIQTLDRESAKVLEELPLNTEQPQEWVNYLYTTLLIEERAEDVYPAYLPLAEEIGKGPIINAIVKDEVKHLSQILEHLSINDQYHEARLEKLRPIEEDAFGAFVDGLEKAWQNR